MSKGTWHCDECGSENMARTVTQHINTLEVEDTSDGELWCYGCEEKHGSGEKCRATLHEPDPERERAHFTHTMHQAGFERLGGPIGRRRNDPR